MLKVTTLPDGTRMAEGYGVLMDDGLTHKVSSFNDISLSRSIGGFRRYGHCARAVHLTIYIKDVDAQCGEGQHGKEPPPELGGNGNGEN